MTLTLITCTGNTFMYIVIVIKLSLEVHLYYTMCNMYIHVPHGKYMCGVVPIHVYQVLYCNDAERGPGGMYMY